MSKFLDPSLAPFLYLKEHRFLENPVGQPIGFCISHHRLRISKTNIPASCLDPQGERAQSGASDQEAPGFGAILHLLDTDGCPLEGRSYRSIRP